MSEYSNFLKPPYRLAHIPELPGKLAFVSSNEKIVALIDEAEARRAISECQ